MKSLIKNFSLIIVTLAVAGFFAGCKNNAPKEQEKAVVTEQNVTRKVAVQAYSFKEFTFFEAIDKTVETGAHYIEAYPGQNIGGGIEGTTHFSMDQETRDAINTK